MRPPRGPACQTPTIRVFSMGDGSDIREASLATRFEAVTGEIAGFRPRQPHQHPDLLGGEGAIPLERIFAGVARGREAIDLAIGEGLRALEDGDRLMDLGFSKMTDYAREILGLPASTARDKVKLARGLSTRPLLREAVRSGRLSPRKALEVLPLARGEAEKPWLLLASTLSVRELRRAVARARTQPVECEDPAPEPPDEERWRLLSLPLRAEDRAVVEEAMRLAGEVLGQGAPAWERLEAIAQEFLGSHPAEPGEDEMSVAPKSVIPPEEMEAALEIVSNGWDWLEAVEPVAAPELEELELTALDDRLRELAGKRIGWDEVFGGLARMFTRSGLARRLGFANMGHYLKERLGVSRRAVEQRVWLERRMEELPQLRYALERGELPYEKARLVAGVADFDSVNGWIGRAQGLTCVELERAIAQAQDAQACVRERLEAQVPERVARLLEAALRAAAETEDGPLDPAACLASVARHFVEVWGPLVRRRNTPRNRAMERDGWWCRVPACSRPAAQGHHVIRRSHGGGEGAENLTALCAPHHLRGIHGGRLRVSGTAPDHLVWELASGACFGKFTPVA